MAVVFVICLALVIIGQKNISVTGLFGGKFRRRLIKETFL